MKTRYATRKDFTDGEYIEIYDTEVANFSHPNYNQIIQDSEGEFRWEGKENIIKFAEEFGINEITIKFDELGITKNSECYRQFYRDLGYTLWGYWELFYWDVNNPEAENYERGKDTKHDFYEIFGISK